MSTATYSVLCAIQHKTDAATGEHGDLLDLIRHRSRAPSLRAALDEARAFLALPVSPATGSGDSFDATEAARRLWRQCRTIAGTHAEAYLHARGLSRCRFAALRFHPELRYRDGNASSAGFRRWSPPSPATTTPSSAYSAPGSIRAGPPRRASRRRARRSAASTASPCDSAIPPTARRSLVGEGIETVLSVVAAVPEFTAAAALSAGSLGAFAPPPGVARLVIARDNDPDGATAAERLARRCARAGVGATVIVPVGNDFNDDLTSTWARRRSAPGSHSARPLTREGEESGVGGKAIRREERVYGRRHQSEARAEAPRSIRVCACAQQHRADRPPHEMGQSVSGSACDGTRDEVIARYRADLWRRIRAGETALEELAELDGCWLACHCDPLPCHGHVLERAAAWASGVLAERAGG